MDYIEADDLFFSVLESGGATMFSTAGKTAFPKTYRAMFGFCAKTNALKTAMFDMIESNNPYAFKTLFRCYCDHYLKFTYLFVRFVLEKSDEVGREYFSFCGAIETRDYLKSIMAAEAIFGNQISGDVKGAIEAVYPDAATLSMKELQVASAKFRYREILRFLSAQAPDLLNSSTPFLASIVPAYAEMSSFVHGGPWSDLDMQGYVKPEALEECRRLAAIASLMSASTVMMTAICVTREFPECGQLAANMSAALNRVKGSATGQV